MAFQLLGMLRINEDDLVRYFENIFAPIHVLQ